MASALPEGRAVLRLRENSCCTLSKDFGRSSFWDFRVCFG